MCIWLLTRVYSVSKVQDVENDKEEFKEILTKKLKCCGRAYVVFHTQVSMIRILRERQGVRKQILFLSWVIFVDNHSSGIGVAEVFVRWVSIYWMGLGCWALHGFWWGILDIHLLMVKLTWLPLEIEGINQMEWETWLVKDDGLHMQWPLCSRVTHRSHKVNRNDTGTTEV